MNKPEYFIAIIPPKEYTEKIIQFQKLWKNNSLPHTVEPHITLKSQAGLENGMNWLDPVKAICKSFSSFKLTISGVKTFGTYVVYLSIIFSVYSFGGIIAIKYSGLFIDLLLIQR